MFTKIEEQSEPVVCFDCKWFPFNQGFEFTGDPKYSFGNTPVIEEMQDLLKFGERDCIAYDSMVDNSIH